MRTMSKTLQGSELILPGLDDLQKRKMNTIGALLVTIAAIRLSNAGLNVPKDNLIPEPELTSYEYLQNERDDAYPYYYALFNSLSSFCNALKLISISPSKWITDRPLPRVEIKASTDRRCLTKARSITCLSTIVKCELNVL